MLRLTGDRTMNNTNNNTIDFVAIATEKAELAAKKTNVPFHGLPSAAESDAQKKNELLSMFLSEKYKQIAKNTSKVKREEHETNIKELALKASASHNITLSDFFVGTQKTFLARKSGKTVKVVVKSNGTCVLEHHEIGKEKQLTAYTLIRVFDGNLASCVQNVLNLDSLS